MFHPFYLGCFCSVRRVGASQDLYGVMLFFSMDVIPKKKKSSSPDTKPFQTCTWSFLL